MLRAPEPKLKCHLDVVVPVNGDDVAAARATAAHQLAAIQADTAAADGL